MLRTLSTGKVFTTLDLRGAYNLLRIKEGDEPKTSFITKYGQFEFLVIAVWTRQRPSAVPTHDECTIQRRRWQTRASIPRRYCHLFRHHGQTCETGSKCTWCPARQRSLLYAISGVLSQYDDTDVLPSNCILCTTNEQCREKLRDLRQGATLLSSIHLNTGETFCKVATIQYLSCATTRTWSIS
ncbi:hypothetical protein BASA83_007152 [Batrachochytrium salamandrivorans]|nr:hypothetical protein BASA83_007152 [Batrachochytrium salamandrivorans]